MPPAVPPRHWFVQGATALLLVAATAVWQHWQRVSAGTALLWVWVTDVGSLPVMLLLILLMLLLTLIVQIRVEMFRVNKRFDELTAAASRATVAFTSVSQTEAIAVLQGTQLTLVVGDRNELLMARGRRAVALSPFAWDMRLSETAGSPAALEHLKESLGRLGVRFGPGGYELLHTFQRRSFLSFRVGDKQFTGGVDGVVVPYSIAPLSAVHNARAVIELKKPDRGGEPFGDSAIGQCIAELIGVSSRSVHPCLLLLTDCATCDVLRLQGSLVTRWAGVPLAEALPYVAEYLTRHSSAALEFSDADAERLEPRTARTMQRLRQLSAPSGALPSLLAQLESLTAAEGLDDDDTEQGRARRVALATELVGQWRHALEPDELPQHVQHLFA